MFQEEIARLTGKLVFQVDNRPLTTFQKNLTGVLNGLKELSTLANKKFTVKVALDSRSLRAQIDKATKTKITLNNVDISNEALHTQGKRIQDYLNKTTINLNNVKVDIGKLIEQKRFIKTLLGQMQLTLPVKLGLNQLERELRTELQAVGKRQHITVEANINTTQFIIKLRRALKHAQNSIGALKIRIADPQVRLKVDKQHLIDEIKAAIASHEFRIRINARDQDFGGGRRGSGGGGGRGQAERGLSAAAGFARGALPGLGAAFALSEMNQINQQVQAATNSLHAVSGDEKTFGSNKVFLENMAKEMGLNFRDIAPQFSSIFQAAAPSIGAGGTQDMFRGIMKFGTVHGLDKESMKGSMRALSQMFGKDKIQSEEARQQFAERMPGGMKLLAEAAKNAGISKTGTVKEFEDIMKSGKGDPTKILPELAKLMETLADKNDAYAKSLLTTRVAQGRMNKAFEDSVMLFAEGGFDRGMASFFNALTDGMERAKPLTEALGGAFEILIKPINALIRIVGAIGENWGKFAEALGVSKTALATFASALAIFMLPFGAFITAIGVAALAIDDLLTYFAGGESVFGNLVKETPGATEAVDSIGKSFKGITDNITLLLEKLGLADIGFKSLTINDVFLKTLNTIDSVLQNILNTMNLIKAITQGDAKAADQAASGINLTGGRTTYMRLKDAGLIGTPGDPEPETNSGPGFWSRMGTWAGSPASQRGSIYNDVIAGRAATGQGANATKVQPITIAPGAIPLTLTVQAPEGTDPHVFGDKLGVHVQTLLNDGIMNMLGAARAQQAEGQ
ncbi:tape measure protein [Pseudomonas phage phiPsa267]|uniref:Tape measure protein n=1 Tax=Pseudomonas phage phiPsa267 TaxID=1460361 RepID=A0A7G9V0Q1_9CAUD|nr:tape measure protein [Pseudomonas phage phiPsa267]QNN99856.1 tape measure protein [Pseudomonas phage phiPsa267]